MCDCGTIFKPKRIQNIEVVYAIKESVEKPVDNPEESGKMEDIECVSRAINMMISLGYSKKDAQDSVIFIFKNEHIFDPSVLVKKAVLHIGGI